MVAAAKWQNSWGLQSVVWQLRLRPRVSIAGLLL